MYDLCACLCVCVSVCVYMLVRSVLKPGSELSGRVFVYASFASDAGIMVVCV